MAIREIKNLDELVFGFVEKSNFIGATINTLTAAGENYCSELLAVDISVRDGENTKIIRTVAKLLPQNEFVQKLLQSERTFFLEVEFYKTFVPCLRQFQQEKGFTQLFNAFPEFYTARFNLEQNSEKIDENAVLVIKNLKDEGFVILDRKVGFDLDQAKPVLEKMAELHATVFALRALKPEVFDSKLGELFEEFVMYEAPKEDQRKFVDSLLKLIEDDDFCAKNMDRIRDTLLKSCEMTKKKNDKAMKHRFSSFCHFDMWTNNIMVKSANGIITDVKFVDFQIYEYSSLTSDVLLFLFTSVQLSVIQSEFDNLLIFYYENFIKYLRKLKCDASGLTFEEFLNEMAIVAKTRELMHVLLMIQPIYRDEKDAKEVKNMSKEDFLRNNKEQISQQCKQKATYVVHEFNRRGWL
ncbi:uncharacterized protein LOC123005801 [Tribolium madens]|uniref:uncharacterized protein LOC123005801 n=1 Tax=Tribolium madens TaxID=41895 RepID=UPI001CF7228F|nr:uncharacterized protein LOC123005801 [Tribolium madens]